MITPVQLLGHMREHFRDLHFRWAPVVPAGPVTLPAATGRDLDRASERLLCLLHRAAFALADDARHRHRLLGLDDALLPLYADEPYEQGFASLLARPDAILTDEAWKFIEFNVSASVGGQTYVDLFSSFWREYGSGDVNLDQPLARRTDVLAELADDLGVPRDIALVGCARDINLPHSRYYDIEVDALRVGGFTATYYEPAEYAARVAGGSPAALVLQRFVPQDWIDEGRDFRPVTGMRHERSRVVASTSASHVSNKRVLARLSAQPEWLKPDDAAFVDRYVPWTREAVDSEVSYRGASLDLRRLLLDEQERFVLKLAAGNSGRAVHPGADVDRVAWTNLVRNAFIAGTWVAQERVWSVGVPVDVIDPTDLKRRTLLAPAVFGPIVVGGRASGCMVRYDTAGSPGPSVMKLAVPTVLLNCAAWPLG